MKKAYSYLRFSSTGQKDGDSLERQLRIATAYHDRILKNLPLDTSRADQGFSAYKGHQVSRGSLGHFIAEIKAGTIEPGSALIVENLDRISRQGPKIARKLIEQIVDNDVDVHIVNISVVLTLGWENDWRRYPVDAELERAWKESVNKSERCGSAWTKKRHNANGKAAMSSRVPAWLKAEKGKPIEIIPERAKVVRQIFELAAKGIGQYQITDKLTAAKVPPWGPVRKGLPPRWTSAYIRDILASRATLGEYQPKKLTHDKNGKRRRINDGPLIQDYYPEVIPFDLWNKVNESRKIFAKAKFGFNKKKAKFSTRNLFRSLIFDAEYQVPMHFKNYAGHPCLVTEYRPKLRYHKISYPLFEDAVLSFLRFADWKAIAQEGLPAADKQLLLKSEKLAKELDSALKVRSRYEALLDDPEAATDGRINEKYKEASKAVTRLQEAHTTLQAEISTKQTDSSIVANTKGPEIVRIDRHSDDGRTKLRHFLAQRIDRIELTFHARILIPEDQEQTIKEKYGIRSGKGQTTAKILFKGGAQKMAIFDGKKVTLLEFARLPLHGREKRR